jgi:tetratricopeptide (TPR) repeat protein
MRSSQGSPKNILAEAEGLKASDPQQALILVQEALGQSIAQGDVFHEGKCYVLLGEINEQIQEWLLALDNYTRAYDKLASAYSNTEEYRRTLLGLGDMHLRTGHYAEALQYYQHILDQKLSSKDRAFRQLDVSEVYYQMGNYQEALNVVNQVSVNRKVSDPALASRIENQKAKIYAQLNDRGKTQQSFSNSIQTLRTNKKADASVSDFAQDKSLETTKEEIAGVYREQKRYDDEIAIRNQSVEYNLESKNFKAVAKDKVAIGEVLEAKGETSAAIAELEEAARITDTLNNPKARASAYLALADIYERNGRGAQAISAYKKYSTSVLRAESLAEEQLTRKADLIRIQKDIEEVSRNVSIGQREETIQQATVFRQQLIIYGLLLIIAIAVITSYFIYKNAQASKVANQMLALKSLRSQMNPHFIFNALNSVNHFIARQDERTANRFLSEFSQLMRLVLENSQEDFIPLQKEQEILSLYLKLEHYRFRDKFEYEIQSDDKINIDTIQVPPMLIQPYIENAVWHGLRYKESKGKLSLHFRKEHGTIVVEIRDNGIGRKKSAALKTENQRKHNSTGLKNIQQRLAIINKVYKAAYRVTIHDLPDDTGTQVLIHLPINPAQA